MCVAAQNQVHSGPSSSAKNDGIVRKQEFHFRLTRSRQGKRKIFQPNHCVVDAGQPKRIAVQLKVHTLIYQHRYAFSSKQVGNQCRVGPMIVISEDGEHSITCLQATHQLCTGSCILAIVRNVVPCQGYHVRLQSVRGLDSAFNLFTACKRAVVNVGELNYPKALKRSRKSRQVDGMVFDREQIWLTQGGSRRLTQGKRQGS